MTNTNSFRILMVAILFLMCFSACKPFMHGYTWNKAQNAYHLVTEKRSNFGNKRIRYNKGFHFNSELSRFLQQKTNAKPDFIYEYYSQKQCRGIKLFYLNRDSVFVFEEPKRANLKSVLIEARQINADEKQSYQVLLANTSFDSSR